MRGLFTSALLMTLASLPQQPPTTPGQPDSASHQASASPQTSLEKLLETEVKTEWEAFKNKDKKAYADLLAEDFVAVEEDTRGQRTKRAAADEIDHSVISSYNLFALRVTPLNDNAALVTYELTMLFPPKSVVHFKRVLVGEVWQKRAGEWKLRYYQETGVR